MIAFTKSMTIRCEHNYINHAFVQLNNCLYIYVNNMYSVYKAHKDESVMSKTLTYA